MIHEVDVAVIGGGLGGCAAALAACEAGRSVVLTEPTDWLGGQATAQGVSALDEHEHIEHFGGTRSYMAWREAIRRHYRRAFGVAQMPDGAPLNPGNGWVSRLCFEPRVGLAALHAMLAPHVAGGRLLISLNHEPIAAAMADDRVVEVTVARRRTATELDPEADLSACRIRASYFLDATELGDLLPLTHTDYVTGAESRADTGEADAPLEARPHEIQSFTYCFAVEYCPGESHVIPPPRDYARLRDAQPYTLVLRNKDGSPRPFRMFAPGEVGLPFWTYRRLLSRELLDPEGRHGLRDLALINWNGNDYHRRSLIGATADERARIEDEAKRLSLGFLHWLQTECPRDEGGFGYPEPTSTRNLIAACKNIGTTHLSNGAYRLHPVEWNIGESAGALAAFCCETGWTPRRVAEDRDALRRLQDRLRERGVPLNWDPVFASH